MKGFTFFESYFLAIKNQKKLKRLEFYDAIFKYMFEDEEVELSPDIQGFWELIKVSLNNSKAKSKGNKTRAKKEPTGLYIEKEKEKEKRKNIKKEMPDEINFSLDGLMDE